MTLAFPQGARCVFRTVTASNHWKAGTIVSAGLLDMSNQPSMVLVADPNGRVWDVAVQNILQTGWERAA